MDYSTFDPKTARTIRAIFEHHGAGGQIRVRVPVAEDEAVFVLSTREAANLDERGATLALMKLLHRKVWIATDGAIWDGLTQPLDMRG